MDAPLIWDYESGTYVDLKAPIDTPATEPGTERKKQYLRVPLSVESGQKAFYEVAFSQEVDGEQDSVPPVMTLGFTTDPSGSKKKPQYVYHPTPNRSTQ